MSAILPVVLLAMTKKGKFCLNILLDKVLYKIFFSSFFVSATIIVAQIFFGAGAIKQKKRNAPVVNPPVGNPPVVNPLVGNPPAMNSPVGDAPTDSYVLVINGRKYELSGFVLGTSVLQLCCYICHHCSLHKFL